MKHCVAMDLLIPWATMMMLIRMTRGLQWTLRRFVRAALCDEDPCIFIPPSRIPETCQCDSRIQAGRQLIGSATWQLGGGGQSKAGGRGNLATLEFGSLAIWQLGIQGKPTWQLVYGPSFCNLNWAPGSPPQSTNTLEQLSISKPRENPT